MLIIYQEKAYKVADNYFKVHSKHNLMPSKIPYVQIIQKQSYGDYPRLFEYINASLIEKYNLELGYVDSKNGSKRKTQITIDKIVIKRIDAWKYKTKENENHYFYSIHIDWKTNKDFIYETYDIYTFFNRVVPKMNYNLEKYPVKYFNLFYINRITIHDNWSYMWDSKSTRVDSYNSFLKMIYNAKLSRFLMYSSPYGNSYGIRIEMESTYGFNPYIEWLLNAKIDELEYHEYNNKLLYIGYIKNLPNQILEELKLGEHIFLDTRQGILSHLLLFYIKNFNEDYCAKGWKFFNPIWEKTKLTEIEFSQQLFYLYNTIDNLRWWHYIDGERRVGRDDYEWEEDTYIIPTTSPYRFSQKFLELINSKFDINMKYQELENRYYFFKQWNKDDIAGCARRRGGEGDSECMKFMILHLAIEHEDLL